MVYLFCEVRCVFEMLFCMSYCAQIQSTAEDILVQIELWRTLSKLSSFWAWCVYDADLCTVPGEIVAVQYYSDQYICNSSNNNKNYYYYNGVYDWLAVSFSSTSPFYLFTLTVYVWIYWSRFYRTSTWPGGGQRLSIAQVGWL